MPFVGYRNIMGQIQALTEPHIEEKKKVLSKVRCDYRIANNSRVLSTATFKRHSTGATATCLSGHTTDVSREASSAHV
jgi:hypothetical protein